MAAVRCAPPRRLRAFLGAPSAALPVAHPEAAEALRGHAGLGLNPAAAAVLRVLPAVLLHAPAGAGKHALAARVSDELGAHLMDRCALSLLRGGVEPAQVAHALGMLLAEARRAAPCVLVLRRLELLGDALRAEAAAAGEQPAVRRPCALLLAARWRLCRACCLGCVAAWPGATGLPLAVMRARWRVQAVPHVLCASHFSGGMGRLVGCWGVGLCRVCLSARADSAWGVMAYRVSTHGWMRYRRGHVCTMCTLLYRRFSAIFGGLR